MTRSNGGFQGFSERERQEADQFLADLVGGAPGPYRRRLLGRAYPDGEAWEDAPAAGTTRRLIQDPDGYGWLLPTAAVMTPVAARPLAPPAGAQAEDAEVILGTDDRVMVADTTPIAFRFVCCLDLLFTHPTDPSLTVHLRGSGTLISDRHVLTAAHNILNTLPGLRTHGRRTAARVFAQPGRNGRVLPFGESRSRTLRVSPEWTAAPNREFDFGLITLEDAIGAVAQPTLGGAPLGFWSHPRLGGGTHFRPLEVTFLPGRPVNLDGYPADKCGTRPANRPATRAEIAACTGTAPGNARLTDVGSRQWRSFGNVVAASPAAAPRLITYDLDSAAGHSGGPIWLRWERFRNIVGIHTGGFRNPAPPPAFIANRGVRITNDMLRQIREWMRADGVTPTF